MLCLSFVRDIMLCLSFVRDIIAFIRVFLFCYHSISFAITTLLLSQHIEYSLFLTYGHPRLANQDVALVICASIETDIICIHFIFRLFSSSISSCPPLPAGSPCGSLPLSFFTVTDERSNRCTIFTGGNRKPDIGLDIGSRYYLEYLEPISGPSRYLDGRSNQTLVFGSHG